MPCRSRRARRAPPSPRDRKLKKWGVPRLLLEDVSEIAAAAMLRKHAGLAAAGELPPYSPRSRARPPSARAAVPTAAVTAEAIAALAAEDDERYERAVSKESTRPPSPPRSAAGELSRW